MSQNLLNLLQDFPTKGVVLLKECSGIYLVSFSQVNFGKISSSFFFSFRIPRQSLYQLGHKWLENQSNLNPLYYFASYSY
jgi:hypothetical protein